MEEYKNIRTFLDSVFSRPNVKGSMQNSSGRKLLIFESLLELYLYDNRKP